MTLLGAAVIGVPFYLTEEVDSGFGTPRSLASTALINIGTTLLLAALLVWLGRRLVSRAEGTARRVVEEKAQEFRRETADIRQELVNSGSGPSRTPERLALEQGGCREIELRLVG